MPGRRGLGSTRPSGPWRRLRGLARSLLGALDERRSVLVIDDDPEVAASLKETLLSQGFGPVWTVPNGEQAIETAYVRTPDTVVLDYRLPGMDGEAVAKKLKKIAPGARIIVFSGVLRQRPAWADAFAPKPEIVALFREIADEPS